MSLAPADIESLLFGEAQDQKRFTQDSPVYPDVWLRFAGCAPDNRVDLLMTPHRSCDAITLLISLRSRLLDQPLVGIISNEQRHPWELACCGTTVVAKLTFAELIRIALPLSPWWKLYKKDDRKSHNLQNWFRQLVGAVALSQVERAKLKPGAIRGKVRSRRIDVLADQLLNDLNDDSSIQSCLWSVSINRPAHCQLLRSVPATKADACRRLFNIDGSGIRWAVIDSGIDAYHLAFCKRVDGASGLVPGLDRGQSRVVATYDFTRLRGLLSAVESSLDTNNKLRVYRNKYARSLSSNGEATPSSVDINRLMMDIEKALRHGRSLDWSVLSPLLQIPHTPNAYKPPEHPHGTHVAGIIGADLSVWPEEEPLTGMCPGIELYDLRTMDANGNGDEFSILAALQFVRWLNSQHDQPVIHGVNISLSLYHHVANYACGRTPLCEECERLVGDGVIVVAAAGNQGRAMYAGENGSSDGFRTVSITDPGNAEAVITVGATHRFKPHTYGVSYFSSRGPTGDGRAKPDLLAPGEKIVSTVPGGGFERMDGTSMAAPHVSGAAALLLAQYAELIGQPKRVKDILCSTATDLHRERYFQGCGMLDVLRAAQSV